MSANVTANFHAETITELYTTTGQFVDVIDPDIEVDHTIILPMDLNKLFQRLPLSRVPIDDTSADNPFSLYRRQSGALCKATKVDKRASYAQAVLPTWDTKFKDIDAILTYQPVRGDDWTVCTDETGEFVRLADADAATISPDRSIFIPEQLTRLLVKHDRNEVLDSDPSTWGPEDQGVQASVKETGAPGVYEVKHNATFYQVKFNSESGPFAYTSIEILGSTGAGDPNASAIAPGVDFISIQYPSPNFVQEVKRYLDPNTQLQVDLDAESLAVFAKFDNNARVGNSFRIHDGTNSDDLMFHPMTGVTIQVITAVVTKRKCDRYGSDADAGVLYTSVASEEYTLEEHHRTFNVTQAAPPQAEMNKYNRLLVRSDVDDDYMSTDAQTSYKHELLTKMGELPLLESGLVLADTDRPYCMPIELGDFLYVSNEQLTSRPIYDSRRFLDYCVMQPNAGPDPDATIDVDFSIQEVQAQWQAPADRANLEKALDELKYGHEANIRIKNHSGSSFQWGRTRHSELSDDKESNPTFTAKITEAIKDLFKVDENEAIRVRFNPDRVADYVSSEEIQKISCGVFTGRQMREILDACIQFGRINQKSTLDGVGSSDKHEGYRLHLNEADKIGVTVKLYGSTPETEQGITVRIWLEQLAVPELPTAPGPNNFVVDSMSYAADTQWLEFNSSIDTTKRDDIYKALKKVQGEATKEDGQDTLYLHAKVHGDKSELAARNAAENTARGD